MEKQIVISNIDHCFLIEKLWIDEMENRNPCGYSPFGYVKTEKEAKDICDNSRLLNGEDCWALKYIGSRKEYRYKEIKEITKEVINEKRDYY